MEIFKNFIHPIVKNDYIYIYFLDFRLENFEKNIYICIFFLRFGDFCQNYLRKHDFCPKKFSPSAKNIYIYIFSKIKNIYIYIFSDIWPKLYIFFWTKKIYIYIFFFSLIPALLFALLIVSSAIL